MKLLLVLIATSLVLGGFVTARAAAFPSALTKIKLSAEGGQFSVCEIKGQGGSGGLKLSVHFIDTVADKIWAPLASIILGSNREDYIYRMDLLGNRDESLRVKQKFHFGREAFVSEPLYTLKRGEALNFELSWTNDKWIEVETAGIRRSFQTSKQPMTVLFLVSGGTATAEVSGPGPFECERF